MVKVWLVVIQGSQCGPMSNTELKALADSGQLKPTDYVWKEGLTEWIQARKIKSLFPPSPPPLPSTTTPPLPATSAGQESNPTTPNARKKPIENYDPIGDTFHKFAVVQEAAQKRIVNWFYRAMDCVVSLPFTKGFMQNRRNSAIACGVTLGMIVLLGMVGSEIEKQVGKTEAVGASLGLLILILLVAAPLLGG